MTIAENWKRPLKIAGVCAAVLAVGIGLWLSERYLHTVRQAGWGPLALEDPPAWVEESLPLKMSILQSWKKRWDRPGLTQSPSWNNMQT